MSPANGQNRGERLLALGLTILVAVASVWVAVVMFAPSDRDAVVAALTETGEEILAAAKTYPERAHLFEPQIPEDAMGAGQSSPLASGPFTGMRFDRLGYFERLSPDARTYYTEVGHFTLQVSPDGQSFSLTAFGPEEITVHWEGHAEDAPAAEE